MLDKCHKYSVAINAKGKSFPTLIMALLLEQHKMINRLENKMPEILQMFKRRRFLNETNTKLVFSMCGR
jgi:hypothetical protein